MTRLLISVICLFLVISKIPILYFFGGVGLILVCTYQVTCFILLGTYKTLGISPDHTHNHSYDNQIASVSNRNIEIKKTENTEELQKNNQSDTLTMPILLSAYIQQYIHRLDLRHVQQLEQIQEIFSALTQQKIQLHPSIYQKIEVLQQHSISKIEEDIQYYLNLHKISTMPLKTRLFNADLQQSLTQYTEEILIQSDDIYANDMQLLKEHHIFITQQLKKLDDFQVNKNLPS